MMKKFSITYYGVAFAGLLATTAANADVLTSLRPLGFIAAGIADGVTNTDVLVPVGASPHDYSLKLSDVQKLRQADLVVWIGEDVDSFLARNVAKLPPQNVVTIADLAGVKPLLLAGEAHHHHHHDDADHDHHHDELEHHHDDANHNHHTMDEKVINWHLWLSPQISEQIADVIAVKLESKYPAQKAKILANLASFKQNLAKTNAEIAEQLAPYSKKGFVVYHDAYDYFNQAYHLNQQGSFTINPIVAPGVRTLAKVKQMIAHKNVQCLFTEPEFTPDVVQILHKETGVNVGSLDPLGSKITLSKTAYMQFLQHLATNYAQCLK